MQLHTLRRCCWVFGLRSGLGQGCLGERIFSASASKHCWAVRRACKFSSACCRHSSGRVCRCLQTNLHSTHTSEHGLLVLDGACVRQVCAERKLCCRAHKHNYICVRIWTACVRNVSTYSAIFWDLLIHTIGKCSLITVYSYNVQHRLYNKSLILSQQPKHI